MDAAGLAATFFGCATSAGISGLSFFSRVLDAGHLPECRYGLKEFLTGLVGGRVAQALGCRELLGSGVGQALLWCFS